MKRLAPSYIRNYLTDFHTVDKEEIEFTGKLIGSNGGTKFRIQYYGELLNGLIMSDDELQELIYAEEVESREQILLFDGCKAGYNNMFCDEHDEKKIARRSATKLYTDQDGNEIFEIYLSYYFNIDFDEEMEDFTNDAGEIELINGEVITPELLRSDCFDAYSIDAINKNGTKLEVSSAELA